MNEYLIDIPGRLHSVAVEKHVAGTDQIYDDFLKTTLDILNLENITDVKVQDGKFLFLNIQGLVLKEISIASVQKQSDWNLTDSTQVDFIKSKPIIYNKLEVDDKLITKQDTISDLDTIRSGAQAGATAYQKPATGIPATDFASDVQNDLAAIEGIEAVIPEQASESNQLADKDFVNSSIATATATYRGSYNLVSDLLLSVSATQQQIATALATKMAALSITPDNNDYCYVQIPTADATPTEIAHIDRDKYNGTAWEYEYTLNNSGFTAAQWAALNSDITSGLVDKLSSLPTNSELTTLLNGKADVSDLIPVDSIWKWSNTAYLLATDIQTLDGVWIDKSATSATKEKYIYINKLSSNLLIFTSGYYSYNFNNGFIIPKGQQMIRDENMVNNMQTALIHVPYAGLLSLWMGTPSDVSSASQYVEIADSNNNVIKHYSSGTLSQLSSPIILKVNSGNYYIRYFRVNFFFHSAMLVRYELPLSELLDDATHRLVTDDEKTAWNNKSSFSGSYNDLSDTPTIPDITGKADKVSNATNGNFAALDSNGNLIDSEHKHSDYLTQHQDLSNYVQKSQTAGLLKNDGTVDTNTYLTQHQDISGKADKSEMSVVAGTGANADKATITLKQGTSATVLTAHQDITGKEDVTTIVTPVNTTDATLPITTLTCEVGKYYRIDVAVDTLGVTLPAMTDLTTVRTVVICLTADTNPAVTISAADNKDVYYQDGFDIEAGNTYEINALFNGNAWIVASVKINVE